MHAFFKLLDELTIARSASTFKSTTRTPSRSWVGFLCAKSQLSLFPEIDIQGLFLSYDKLNSEIDQYKLSLFNPSKYVQEKFRDVYTAQSDSRSFLPGRSRDISHWDDESELSKAS